MIDLERSTGQYRWCGLTQPAWSVCRIKEPHEGGDRGRLLRLRRWCRWCRLRRLTGQNEVFSEKQAEVKLEKTSI